jgi:hypothetical protein
MRLEYYKNRNTGDNPELVKLLSSSNKTFFVPAEKNRMEKIVFLSDHKIALNNLRVCWKSKSFYNCSQCEKCLRTMTALDLVNKLEYCPTFNIDNYDINKISRVFLPNNTVRLIWSDILDYAIKVNRKDIAKAIRSSLRISRIIKYMIINIKRLKRKKHFYKIGRLIENLFLRKIIY